jgi:hypothetical protein
LGLNVTVVPVGTLLADNDTLDENPLIGESTAVTEPLDPDATQMLVGTMLSEKSVTATTTLVYELVDPLEPSTET